MNKKNFAKGIILVMLSMMAPVSARQIEAAPSNTAEVDARQETLNPEGINPHSEAPRKKISQEKKQAAAEARKKRQAEKAARKTGQQDHRNPADRDSLPSGMSRDSVNK